jgi:hypothetical protein
MRHIFYLFIVALAGTGAAVPAQSPPPQTNTFWNDPAVLRLDVLKPVFKADEPVLVRTLMI